MLRVQLGFDQGLVEASSKRRCTKSTSCPRPGKALARGWYILNVLTNDGHWYEAVFDDFRTICGILGITRRTRSANAGRERRQAVVLPSTVCSQLIQQGRLS